MNRRRCLRTATVSLLAAPLEGVQTKVVAVIVAPEELVRLNVDVIVTGSSPVVAAVKETKTTIPVVMLVSRDPVGAGFVASLARPGGHITGLSNDPGPEMHGKNLETLKDAVPGISRVAYLWNPVPPGAATYRQVVKSAATRLGVILQPTEVRGRNEFERAFTAMVRERAEAVVVAQDPVLFSARSHVVHEVRAGDQHESGQGARPHDPAIPTPPRRPRHRMSPSSPPEVQTITQSQHKRGRIEGVAA
jgi:ABC-type uncharacterized transport system substrate-binding protein